MQLVCGHASYPAALRGAALAIGNFDGVHRGHQALIRRAEEVARAGARRAAGVIVFEPHPRAFFRPGEPHFEITPLAEKLRVLEALGLDVAVVLAFDAALAATTAVAFIDEILVGRLGVGHVVVGYDFFFGKARAGTPAMLAEAGRRHGFGVSVIEPVAEEGEVFSSSAIRARLAAGDVAAAARMLGRPWRVSGTVIGGARIGTGLGFPTANLALASGTALGHGIYAARVHVGDDVYAAAAYLGTRPTVDGGRPLLEVFLFDFTGDLYGREIAVDLVDFIRGDRKFDGIEALKLQMAADCARAREILALAG
jgi:riboflavin kinase/FMN adenylyltransferase